MADGDRGDDERLSDPALREMARKVAKEEIGNVLERMGLRRFNGTFDVVEIRTLVFFVRRLSAWFVLLGGAVTTAFVLFLFRYFEADLGRFLGNLLGL